jgi:hypothetical protein
LKTLHNTMRKGIPSRSKYLALILGLGFSLLAGSQAGAKGTDATGEVDYFTNNGFSNTVGTMQHPAGEYYKGVCLPGATRGPLRGRL